MTEKKTTTQLSVLQEILRELKNHTSLLVGYETKMQPRIISQKPIGPVVKTKEELQEVLEKAAKEVNETPISSKAEYPVPAEYREVVETILNKEFEIRCDPLSDKPAFSFTIVVPEQYSNATKQHREMYGGDLRSKVINYAEGTNGVRDWTQKVLDNLNPEARTKISIAREQVKV